MPCSSIVETLDRRTSSPAQAGGRVPGPRAARCEHVGISSGPPGPWVVQAQERREREAASHVEEREGPRGSKARRAPARGGPKKPDREAWTGVRSNPLKPRGCARPSAPSNGRRGRTPRGARPSARRKALKVEPQERYRAETGLERIRGEQAVERVRNPEDGRWRGLEAPR